jgi:hypothetical protein
MAICLHRKSWGHAMHEGGGGGGGLTAGGEHSSAEQPGGEHSGGVHPGSEHSDGGHQGGEDASSGQSGGVHAGSGHGSSGPGGFDPGRQRDAYVDPLDPRGPMGMPKIVGRVLDRAGRGQPRSGTVAAAVYVVSVLAIIIAFAVYFIAGGH